MELNSELVKKIAIILFFVMFLYSGINKILNFNKKVSGLKSKVNLSEDICSLGMILVILLEIVGSLVIYYNIINPGQFRYITDLIYKAFLLFLVVVTAIYHPPTDKIIPFLSNVTTFAGILYLYADFKNKK